MWRELTAAAGAGAYVPSTDNVGHPKSALDQHCKKKYIYIYYIYTISHTYTWTLQGVPNAWERVPLSNPLGFKHYPLEGAGNIFHIYNKASWPGLASSFLS